MASLRRVRRATGGRLQPIATIAELKAAGISIKMNTGAAGIPQGTPISSVLSNLYLLQFDRVMAAACDERGALYQRYSDDIMVICAEADESALSGMVEVAVKAEGLEIKSSKTTRALFDIRERQVFQYLGFDIAREGAVIRGSSMARQWRKARRSLRKARAASLTRALAGSPKMFTRKLRRRFQPVGARNFSSYARRAATVFGSTKMVKQVRNLERMVDASIREIEAETLKVAASSHAPTVPLASSSLGPPGSGPS